MQTVTTPKYEEQHFKTGNGSIMMTESFKIEGREQVEGVQKQSPAILQPKIESLIMDLPNGTFK